MNQPKPFGLDARIDPETGQLLSLKCPATGQVVIAFDPGEELELNGHPLPCRLVEQQDAKGEVISTLRARVPAAYGAGVTLEIRRLITLGGVAVHVGPPDSVHIRYEVRRVPHTECGDEMDAIWQPEIEAPLPLQTLTVLAAPTKWFGEGTRMRALAIGGSGPREHVSLEDGPIEACMPYLQSGFRTTFPGSADGQRGDVLRPRERPIYLGARASPASGGAGRVWREAARLAVRLVPPAERAG